MNCRLIIIACFVSVALGGFPSGRTIFRDWKTHDTLFKSYNLYTETWKFQQEYELSGVILGSRREDVTVDNSTTTDTYTEIIRVELVKHNGTYGAPRTLMAVGNFNGTKSYNSTVYIPLVNVEGTGVPTVLPITFENTLYYIEIDIQSPVPGMYPYYATRDLEYFGAVAPGTPEGGIVIGIEYSKPSLAKSQGMADVL